MIKKENNLIFQKKGMALVTSLIILSLIMVSVLAFAKIIMSEVKMSVNIINSIGSFYAANAGMEKSLYYLKYSHNNSSFDVFKNLEDAAIEDIGDSQRFDIIQSSSQYQNFIAYNVSSSSPAYVDIIDPSGSVASIDWSSDGSSPPYRAEVKWQIKDCFPYHASDRLEISYQSFDSGFQNSESDVQIVVCNCAFGSDVCGGDDDPWWTETIYNDRYYRFNFRPLNSLVDRLEMSVKDNADADQGIFSRIAATVDGIYRNSKYRLKAVMPALAPVSGAFSYVIFSEEPLTKDP